MPSLSGMATLGAAASLMISLCPLDRVAFFAITPPLWLKEPCLAMSDSLLSKSNTTQETQDNLFGYSLNYKRTITGEVGGPVSHTSI